MEYRFQYQVKRPGAKVKPADMTVQCENEPGIDHVDCAVALLAAAVQALEKEKLLCREDKDRRNSLVKMCGELTVIRETLERLPLEENSPAAD
ncbi:MAG: hypothetical protein OXE87_01365 [Chloroflexi bacterium]|nr:hypothetical protein [Chloroflexota bacterium]